MFLKLLLKRNKNKIKNKSTVVVSGCEDVEWRALIGCSCLLSIFGMRPPLCGGANLHFLYIQPKSSHVYVNLITLIV